MKTKFIEIKSMRIVFFDNTEEATVTALIKFKRKIFFNSDRIKESAQEKIQGLLKDGDKYLLEVTTINKVCSYLVNTKGVAK